MAMSNLPSMRLVSWNTELGVGVILASRPFLAKRPFSWATQMGQLKPPGKTMRLTVLGGAGGKGAHETSSSAIGPTISPNILRIVFSLGLQARLRVRSRHGLQRRLFDSFVAFAKLRDVGPRAPHAERLRRERELPRPVARFFLGQDVLQAHRIFINHPVRPLEIQEARRGGRMAARAEYDLHVLLAQEIV